MRRAAPPLVLFTPNTCPVCRRCIKSGAAAAAGQQHRGCVQCVHAAGGAQPALCPRRGGQSLPCTAGWGRWGRRWHQHCTRWVSTILGMGPGLQICPEPGACSRVGSECGATYGFSPTASTGAIWESWQHPEVQITLLHPHCFSLVFMAVSVAVLSVLVVTPCVLSLVLCLSPSLAAQSSMRCSAELSWPCWLG